MAVTKRRLELNCIICSQPLSSMQTCLPQDVLQMVAEQNIAMKRKTDHTEYNNHVDIDQYQAIATKCGHMFHMGCIRSHVKSHLDRVGSAPCPICSKPVTLTRIWPVLIPPTPAQLSRIKKLNFMKTENTELKVELAEIRKKVKACEAELKTIEQETESCLADIQIKQQQLEDMNGPTESELEELRRIHKNRQSIVRVVTKHNADLLGVLMHETNLQVSDADLALSDQDIGEINHNLPEKKDPICIYENSLSTRRNRSRSRSLVDKDRSTERSSRYQEKFHSNNFKGLFQAPSEQNSESESDHLNGGVSSDSFSPNNARPLTPFHYPPTQLRKGHHRHKQGPNLVKPTKSEIRSFAINKTAKAGAMMEVGNYTRTGEQRRVGGGGMALRAGVGGDGGPRGGLALTRKDGTRGIVNKDYLQPGNRLVQQAVTKFRPPVISHKNISSNNQNKVSRSSYRPKWC